jgi:acetylornithine deacetylase/succinyl-diaminopimelate desuccinylase-like protein
MGTGNFEIGRTLHLKSEIRNRKLDWGITVERRVRGTVEPRGPDFAHTDSYRRELPHRPSNSPLYCDASVRFAISDFGFEMQDSSDFEIPLQPPYVKNTGDKPAKPPILVGRPGGASVQRANRNQLIRLATRSQTGWFRFLLPCVISLAPAALLAQAPILESPKFRAAQAFLADDYERTVAEAIAITEIEAPPFKEARRARAFADRMRQSGFTNVEIDAEGNVLGLRKGSGGGPLIAIAAHLDTVFPEGTDVKVKREGTILSAPGIGDDSYALAVLLAMARAMDRARFETEADILFIGDVGEEGPGDLRGMKYLFQKGPYKDRITAFISIDGSGPGSDITIGALGSKRYRVTFKGPGGHSYSSFGLVSPSYALGRAISALANLQVPSSPRTTYNVGMIGGGTSVNSIPFEAWMDVDLRSESPRELNRLAENFVRLMNNAVQEENRAHSTAQGAITVSVEMVGERPSGQTPVSSKLVQTASGVIAAFGLQPTYSTASTDSNIPISLKIPAITMDVGTDGGRAHTLDEWIDVEKTAGVRGIEIILATLLTLAGAR